MPKEVEDDDDDDDEKKYFFVKLERERERKNAPGFPDKNQKKKIKQVGFHHQLSKFWKFVFPPQVFFPTLPNVPHKSSGTCIKVRTSIINQASPLSWIGGTILILGQSDRVSKQGLRKSERQNVAQQPDRTFKLVKRDNFDF